MNKNCFLVICLVLFGLLQQIAAGALNCNNKDAVACKAEFVKQLDLRFQEFHVKEMEKEVTSTIQVFNSAIAELPANDENAEMLKKSIIELRKGVEQTKIYGTDYEKIRAITRNMENHMQPHVMVNRMDKESIAEFEKMLDKYGYTKILENFDFNEFIDAFVKMWMDLYVELRPSDVKEFPAYSEINENMKSISAEKDNKKRQKLIREAVVKVRKFCKIPFLEEFMFYDRKTSKKQ